MFNISKFFINNVPFLFALVFSFLIAGVISFINLNRNEDPGFKIRTASIVTLAENYSAKEIDSGITRPIENIINTMDEIEDIISESYQGKSVIYADIFENYKDIQPIWDRLRRKVELAKNDIYDNLNPIVNDEFGDVFGILIGISKNNADYEELYDIARNIKNDFLKLKSRGRVEIFGSQKEAVYLNFKTSYLMNLKLTNDEIKNYINAINQIKSAGVIYGDKESAEIVSSNGFNSINNIKSRLFNIRGNSIPLDSIFEIEKTTKKPFTKLIKSNGKQSLVIGISLKKGGNILSLGKEVKNEIKKLNKKYKNINIDILSFQSDYVKYLTDKFTSNLFESILAVILVVFLILGIKIGLITGVIIIVTVVSTFFVMKLLNIGLDKISLSALIISLGILVDNSIVIAQGGLSKKFDNKNDLKNFIMSITEKFQVPLFITSICAALAFFPVFIANSTVGEYASNLFKVIFIILLFSWFYSLSLLPYLLIKFSNSNGVEVKKIIFVELLKEKIEFVLNFPKTSVIIAVVTFFISIILFSFTPKIFFPESDRNSYEIKLNLKNGVSFNETERAVNKLESYLKTKNNIVSYSSSIGPSAPRYVLSASPEADKVNFAMFLVNLKDKTNMENEIIQTKNFINKNIINVQAVVKKIPLGPPVNAPIEIRIINDDIDKLFYYKKIISDELKKINGVYLIKDDWGDFIPAYDIKINENAAIIAGITPEYLFNWLNTLYNGKILTYYYRGDVKVPVVLRASDEFLSDISNIKYVSIYSKNKNSIIPVTQVAKISEKDSYYKILRRNNSYVLTVQAWNEPFITSNQVINKIIPVLNKIDGLQYEIGGEWEKSKKGNKSVMEKVPVAFLLIFLILIAKFNDIKKPLMITFCAVIALSGASFGLFITRAQFGFMTFLGYISLVGICMNNGIILVNEINDNNKNKIIEAVKSRVEPVLLTCLTTIGGMFPLWIKNDAMFSTLAISMIFGLLFSFMVTFFVLPSIYYLIYSKND